MYNLYIMKTSQTLARTQIYLTQAQQNRLTDAAQGSGASKSELIRRAIDQFLDQQASVTPADKAARIQGIAGMWSQRDEMRDPVAFVRQLRAPRF